jgi:hypothetical protein
MSSRRASIGWLGGVACAVLCWSGCVEDPPPPPGPEDAGSDDALADASPPEGDGLVRNDDAPADGPSTDAPRTDVSDAPVTTFDAADAARNLADGAPCLSGAQCASGRCIEGVCCDEACGGGCRSCLGKETGGKDGACAPVQAGRDPDDDCTPTGPETCGADGTCDGAGACRLWGREVVCVPASCEASTLSPERRCDGKGACTAGPTIACAPYACAAGKCKGACSSEADCASGSFCAAGGTCTPRKNLGEGCAAGAECVSNACADGICCDDACTGTCSSCRLADTGKPDGTCAPVKAGMDSGGECSPSAASTCGQDGRCDGAGGCRRHVAGTRCAADSCGGPDNQTYTSARMCDGQGTCVAATTTSCWPYFCAGFRCKDECTRHEDCASGHWCSNAKCVAKKDVGATCYTAAECTSGMCGGRCCTDACSCAKPNPANMVRNPGFDTDLASWVATGETGAVASWASTPDFDSCPSSGSLRLHVPKGQKEGRISHCISGIQGSALYSVGYRLFVLEETEGEVICFVYWWTALGCTGGPGTWFIGNYANKWGVWEDYVAAHGSPENANSVALVCNARSSANADLNVLLDKVFVTPYGQGWF